jgi:ABC-type lipoprotein export system ATPase subunit
MFLRLKPPVPISALDTELGTQVMELIRSEMKQRGTAAIVVTHDERITEYCDRTVHIIDGVLNVSDVCDAAAFHNLVLLKMEQVIVVMLRLIDMPDVGELPPLDDE